MITVDSEVANQQEEVGTMATTPGPLLGTTTQLHLQEEAQHGHKLAGSLLQLELPGLVEAALLAQPVVVKIIKRLANLMLPLGEDTRG
jgi:hypothetical protein